MTWAYLYKWTEISTGKWYRGSRTKGGCHPDDGYVSHSKVINPLIAANPSNWIREIECIGDPKYIADLETTWLTLLKAKQDPMSYNQVNHWPACGIIGKPSPKKGKKYGPNKNKCKKKLPPSEETRKKWSLVHKGKKQTLESNIKRSNANRGKRQSEESKIKNSIAKKGKTWEEIYGIEGARLRRVAHKNRRVERQRDMV